PPRIPGAGERVAQLFAGTVGVTVDLVLAEPAGAGAAAEHVAVMPFLVGPGDRLDAQTFELGVGGEGARQFEPVDDAERAVEPAAPRLRLAVRPAQQPPPHI